MATCTVSGTFVNPQGTAIASAVVRFNIESPVLDGSGNLLMPKEITTTTDASGNWSLALIQSVTGNLTLDLIPTSTSATVKYNFSLVIPTTTTATFASCWADSANFSGGSADTPLSFSDISGTLATAQLPALASGKVWVGNGSSLATAVSVSGDATLANTGALTVVSVGASTAANIHAAELLANAATAVNTASTIMKRDGSNQVAATTFTGALAGNATTATTATSFSGSLAGDVTGTQAATTVVKLQGYSIASTTPADAQLQVYATASTRYNPVSLSGDVTMTAAGAATVGTVGGSTAANVHAAELLANAAVSANTASAIVKRDGSGNFTAGTVTATLTGTASGNTTVTPNNHGVVVSGSANTLTVLAPDASATKVLKSGGSSADPSWLAYDNANTVSTLVARDSSGNFAAGTVTATLTGTASGNATLTPNNHGVVLSGSANALTVLAPDSSASKVLKSGGSSADPSWLAYDNANTVSTLVARDSSGNFAAGTITATLTGTASGNTTYSANNHGVVVSGSANTMSVLAPDASATKVLKSGGSSADPSWLAYTDANTASTLVARDGSGNFTAGTITASLTGHASLDIANTLTSATGDIIYASSANTPARLAIGATNNVLLVSGGIPAWGAAPPPTYKAPTTQRYLSSTGTYNLKYGFVITSGSATAAATYTNNAVTFTVYETVASATLVYMTGSGAPAASGTLTKATGTGDATLTFSSVATPVYLKVTCVGGGGGGAGSSTTAAANGNSGGDGGDSTFGTSLLTSGGGKGSAGGGNQLGGAGGTATVASPARSILAVVGGVGGPTSSYNSSVINNYGVGGPGGTNALGGSGAGGLINAAGLAGATNTGAGGGGGGSISSSTWYTGSGGGAGAYIQAIIPSPSATYSYAVGAAGSAGTAGSSGYAGAAGALGLIVVEEYYQ